MTQLTAQQLPAHLQKQVGACYLLCGEEPLQQQESLDAIRAAVRERGEIERASYTVSGANFDWSEIFAALNGLSLFSEQRLIEVHVPSGKPGREGGAALQELAKGLASLQDTVLVLSLPHPLDRPTRNTAWFKAISAVSTVVQCLPIELRALGQWLSYRFERAGLKISSAEEGRSIMQFLTEHVEGNLLAAHQEIEKMALLYQASPSEPYSISLEEVQRSVMNVARYDLFSLPQTLLSGDIGRAMAILSGLLAEGEAAVRIHWVLSNEIQALHQVRMLLNDGTPMPLALRQSRVWGDRERLYERIVPRMDLQSGLRLLRSAQVCDGVIKGLKSPGWPSDAKGALQQLMLEMAGAHA